LKDYIIKKQHLEEKEIIQIIDNILQGIKFLNSNGLIHGDLKSENIIRKSENGD
jgi:serine/threonine protein kinase